MSTTKRDLGELAQSTLKAWAAQVNITANPSSSDREGWDFILQFPIESSREKQPLDRQPSRIECFVQVKGVETKRKRKSVALSNWQKLVSSPLPAFFLIIDFRESNNPQNAYLVHVGEKQIGDVLKRLRSLSVNKKINKVTIDLSWRKADCLSSLDGIGLKQAIEQAIGSDFDAYISGKQKIRTEIGLDAPIILNITSQPFENYEDLIEQSVNWAIGVENSIPVSKVIIEKDVRFGVPAEVIEEEGGILSVLDRHKSGKPVKVLFSNSSGSHRALFPGLLYTPEGFLPKGSIPEKHRKVRVETEIGDFILRTHSEQRMFSSKIKIRVNDEPRKLSELSNLFQIVFIFQNSETDGGFVEISDDVNTPVTLTLQNVINFPEEYLFVAKAVENAWFCARILDVSPDIKLHLIDIVSENKAFSEVRVLYDTNTPLHSFAGKLMGEFTVEADKEYAIVVSRSLKFGNRRVAVCMGFAGYLRLTSNLDEGAYEVKNPRRVSFEYAIQSSDDQLNELRLATEEKLEGRGFNIITEQNLAS